MNTLLECEIREFTETQNIVSRVSKLVPQVGVEPTIPYGRRILMNVLTLIRRSKKSVVYTVPPLGQINQLVS